MKDTSRPLKVFLDTSVLLSGLNSLFGASNFILSLFKLKRITIVISPEVVSEAEEVIATTKFPLLKIPFLDFLLEKPRIISRLTSDEIKTVYKIISTEDTPILAGAIKAKADCLITLDKRFQNLAGNKVGFEILLPSEFLQKYKKES